MNISSNAPSRLTNLYLVYLNKKQGKKREELGKSAQIVDESMLRKDKIESSKTLETEEANSGQEETPINKGFSDLTDLQNEDFVFVY